MSDKMTDEMQRLRDLLPKITAPEPSFLINQTVLMYQGKYYRLINQLTRLRADLAAVTEERDRMRDVVKDAYFEGWWDNDNKYLESPADPEDDWKNSEARAAIEGVTEKKNG